MGRLAFASESGKLFGKGIEISTELPTFDEEKSDEETERASACKEKTN